MRGPCLMLVMAAFLSQTAVGWAQSNDRTRITRAESTSPPSAIPMAGQTLTNQTIIEMTKAGISKNLILLSISTYQGQFVLEPSDFIELARAGVNADVLRAMNDKMGGFTNPRTSVAASRSAQPANPSLESHARRLHSTASSDHPPAVIPGQVGLYAFSDGVLQRIEGRVTAFERSGSRLASAATLGIHASRVNIQIPGRRAHVAVGGRPDFYYRAAPKESAEGGLDLVLTRLSAANGRRQFEIAAKGLWRSSRGISVRHQFDFDASEIEPGLYKLTPTRELENGQYAFYLLRGFEHASTMEGSGFVYDFQVE